MTRRKQPEDNETFVRFVQALRADREFGDMLRKAARLPREIRLILFDQMAAKMRQENEPEDMVEVVRLLQNEGVLKKVLELMDSEP